MERYICIHGHFYQPPRENPWLEAIEVQDSARPYHDWNERITAECYAPNAISRILDDRGLITQLANNYAKMSFNVGPTLLSWMEKNASDVYEAILEADRESQVVFSGHGSALAQSYNHIILPLASSRDKYTQVLWGIRDFEYRFRRTPEGMWLPETAVDLETLEILSELGMRFTILAPHQARLVRPLGERDWRDVSEGRIDTTMAYVQRLPSGRSIVLFFYDGSISRAVAFEKLLNNGDAFARRLLSGFRAERTWPQLVHIATDGESYGHHHRFGEMALAYTLRYIETNTEALLTNYGEFLEKHPPTHEVEIFENTSWSCAHGIGRWQRDCGCNTGSHPEWNQKWRQPLRRAMDLASAHFARKFEESGRSLVKDPQEARNGYIEVILDRSVASIESFLSRHAVKQLNEEEKTVTLKLLELQRHAMLMFTSCGWFFDDISGIEAIQVLHYANRALYLSKEIWGEDVIESEYLELLEEAKSNTAAYGDGRRIFENLVTPAAVDLKKVGAHYAVSSLFEEYNDRASVFCYGVEQEDYQLLEAGKARLALGRARFTSEIVRESAVLTFGVLHFGDHTINCGVREFEGDGAFKTMAGEVSNMFTKGDLPGTIRMLDRHFGASTYSLQSLFRDEKRKVLDVILRSTVSDTEALLRQVYENHVPLMQFMKESNVPLPKSLCAAGEVALNTSLYRIFEQETLSEAVIEFILGQCRVLGFAIDEDNLEYVFRKRLEGMTHHLLMNTSDMTVLRALEEALGLLPSLPFRVNLWKVQNLFFEVLHGAYARSRSNAEESPGDDQQLKSLFQRIAESLSIRFEQQE